MLKQLTTTQVWVHDQDEALVFYTEKLGLELREDVTVPEMGNFRWLSVGIPGQEVSITLMAIPGPPVFVLTHHEREPVVKEGGTTFHFVTDGIESALEQARAAAGDKDVALDGGASVAQQYLRAGSLDELHIHVAPILLGGGVSLFGELGADAPGLKLTSVLESPLVTHLSYEVAR